MDKKSSPGRETEKTAGFRPHKTAAKNLLRPLPDSVRLDCHIALTELQFSRRPASAGFLFSRSLDFLQTVVNTDEPDPESGLALTESA